MPSPRLHIPRSSAVLFSFSAVVWLGTHKTSAHANATPAHIVQLASGAHSDKSNVTLSSTQISCMAETICKLKARIRHGHDAWAPEFCARVAQQITESAQRHHLHPALVLAIAINESDLNERAQRSTARGGAIFAKDGGLMGIRCVLDRRGKCKNGNLRGMQWDEIMDPFTNIELGARILAHYRDGGSVERTRPGPGKTAKRVVFRPCTHKTHAFWAHYNHGPIYKPSGYARHYPHRVAVLYYAVAKALHLEVPEELRNTHLTIPDPGMRRRTADRPIETRYKHLTEHILEASACRPMAALEAH